MISSLLLFFLRTLVNCFFWPSLLIEFCKLITAATSKNSPMVMEKNSIVAIKLIHKNVQN